MRTLINIIEIAIPGGIRILALGVFVLSARPASALQLSQALDIGYMGDLGGNFRFRLDNISEKVPASVHFGIGFVYQFDSGDATTARRIFINNTTGGVIEKHGESVVFSLDIGYPLPLGEKGLIFEPYIGARHNRYTAYYAFIGNNEAFQVRSNPWGVGAGARLKVPISQNGDFFFLNAGAEYYFKAPLLSHGTYYYNPDGVDDRPRNDGTTTFSYEDADKAVRQTRFRPVLALGILYSIRHN